MSGSRRTRRAAGRWLVTVLYVSRPQRVLRRLMGSRRDLVVADGAWAQVGRDPDGLAWALIGSPDGARCFLARQVSAGRLAQVPRSRKEGTLPDRLDVGARLPGVVRAQDWTGEMALLVDDDHLRTARKAGLGELVPLVPAGDVLRLPTAAGAALVGLVDDREWGATLGQMLSQAGCDRPLVVPDGAGGYRVPPGTPVVGATTVKDLSVAGLIRDGESTWTARARDFTILPAIEEHLEDRQATRVVHVAAPERSRLEGPTRQVGDLDRQVAALRARLERERAEVARLRRANQALSHAASPAEAREVGDDAPPASAPSDDASPVLPQPVAPPRLDDLGRVLEWARTLSHVHVEDGADRSADLDRMTDRVGAWARQLAEGLALVDGWARALEAGHQVSPYAYARAVGARARLVCMKESRQVEDNPAWYRARVRPCCAAADPAGEHFFAPHLRMGGKGSASPRAHFDLGSDGRVHVGYVGAHLPNTFTMNRQLGAWR